MSQDQSSPQKGEGREEISRMVRKMEFAKPKITGKATVVRKADKDRAKAAGNPDPFNRPQ